MKGLGKLAVAAGLAAGLVGMAAMSACSSAPHLSVKATFADVGDLAVHAPVLLDDIKVGSVNGIALDGREALVTMAIDRGAHIPSNVVAQVTRTSLLGERVVELQVPAGSPAGPTLLADGQTIRRTEVRPDLEDLVQAGNTVLAPITASEVATLVDEGATGFGNQGPNLRILLDDFQQIVHTYAGQTNTIQSLIESMNQLNTALAAHASAQGQSVANTAQALNVLNDERIRLQNAIHALARLAVGARGILDAHEQDMEAFFSQARTILGVLQAEQAAITAFLRYAPLHNGNTQTVEYQEFNQIYQDFVICGLNDNPNDPARRCNGG
jgi:phospholipid/cholesterol/gamma-HCH transport system substrate-binding protein